MNKELYKDSLEIINYSINEVLPEKSIKKVLNNIPKTSGKTIMISIGKAAFTMAKEMISFVHIDKGLVVTKYGHSNGKLENTTIIEAGHPLPDSNSIKTADRAIEMCSNLNEDDIVIMLISGGGSSLFESPLIDLKRLQIINNKLINAGASIKEINTIRKRLSKVKGGKFAQICKPARVINIVLSDVIGDMLDVIASGPTYPDNSLSYEAIDILNKYHINVDEKIKTLLKKETIKQLDNIETYIIGNNEELKRAAKTKAEELGYKAIYVNKPLTDDIKDAVLFLKSLFDKHKYEKENICIILGGEITLEVKGDGVGGRNMELACCMATHITDNSCFFAIGSDGSDGPTDASGGYVDKELYNDEIDTYLLNNDSYHYLNKHGGLIKTGPTGTNVCDLYCILIKNKI